MVEPNTPDKFKFNFAGAARVKKATVTIPQQESLQRHNSQNQDFLIGMPKSGVSRRINF